MHFKIKYSRSYLLLLYCILQVSSVAHPYESDCCDFSEDYVDCINANVIEVPKPFANATGWCQDVVISFGKDVINISLTSSNIKRLKEAFFIDYPNVQNITMDNCNLSFLEADAFRDPGKTSPLEHLSLRNSLIMGFDAKAFAGLTALYKLDLGMNQLAHLPDGAFESLENLTELWLNGNKISKLDTSIFNPTNSLRRLYLSSNSFEQLEPLPTSLGKLKELYIDNNKISHLHPDFMHNLRKLEIIDLGDNNLRKLDGNFFMNNHNVYSINLKNNVLETLPRETFRNLCELSWLNIQNNNLTTPFADWFANVAYQSKFYIKRYRSVVSENPWRCDCQAADYADFIVGLYYDQVYKALGLIEHFNIKCDTGKKIVEIDDDKQTCKHNLLHCEGEVEHTRKILDSSCTKAPLCRFLLDTCGGDIPVTTGSIFGPSTFSPTQEILRPALVFVGVTALIILAVLAYFIKTKRKTERKRRESGSSTEDCNLESPNAVSNQWFGYVNENLCPIPRTDPDGASEPSSSPSVSLHSSTDSISSSSEDFENLSDEDESITQPKTIISSGRNSITIPKQLYDSDVVAISNSDYTPMTPSIQNPETSSCNSDDTSSAFPGHRYEIVPNTIDGYEEPILQCPPPPPPHTNPPTRQKKVLNRRSQKALLLPAQSGFRSTVTGKSYKKDVTKRLKEKKTNNKTEKKKKRRK